MCVLSFTPQATRCQERSTTGRWQKVWGRRLRSSCLFVSLRFPTFCLISPCPTTCLRWLQTALQLSCLRQWPWRLQRLLRLGRQTSYFRVVPKDIASRFCTEAGVDTVKDFYISGLISLEEVQVSLPHLLQVRKLEEAVTKQALSWDSPREALELILRSSRFFSAQEWQKYVGRQVVRKMSSQKLVTF